MIPKNINRNHILEALKEIEKNGVPDSRKSTKYLMAHNGKTYPPKYVISLANIYANGEHLQPRLFYGGNETNEYLNSLGFSTHDKKHP